MCWDALHRLVQVEQTGGTVVARYAYDALGRRISKAIDNSVNVTVHTVRFVWDGRNLIEEHDADGFVSTTSAYPQA